MRLRQSDKKKEREWGKPFLRWLSYLFQSDLGERLLTDKILALDFGLYTDGYKITKKEKIYISTQQVNVLIQLNEKSF